MEQLKIVETPEPPSATQQPEPPTPYDEMANAAAQGLSATLPGFEVAGSERATEAAQESK